MTAEFSGDYILRDDRVLPSDQIVESGDPFALLARTEAVQLPGGGIFGQAHPALPVMGQLRLGPDDAAMAVVRALLFGF